MKDFWRLEGLEGNILKYTIALIANKRIFVAILGAYYLTIPGVTPWWIGVILLVSSLAGFLFEIPSGYFADKVGHKKALVLHALFLLASTTFFLLAESIPLLMLGGVCLSVGHALMSGTGSAFMHETMRALGREGEFREIMGKMSSIGFGVPIVFMVLVPFLVEVSWQLPFLIALVTDTIGLFAVCSLVVPKVTPEQVDEIRLTNFKQVMKEAWRIHFFRYALFSGILGGILLGISGFRAVYQATLGIPIIWFGVLFGVGRMCASILLWYSGPIQRGLRTPVRIYGMKLVLFSGLLLILAFTSVPVAVAIAFILINAFHWGLNNVGYSVEATGKSNFKATLLSVKSQVQALVGAGAALLSGYLIETVSYEKSFFILTIIMVLVLTPILYLIYRDRKTGVGGISGGDGGD
jgi:MFS family permease